MSRKSKITEEIKSNLYPYKDAEEIRRFYKIVNASPADMESIYEMYKKYVKPNARRFVTNCKCPSSISAYYQNLLEWFNKNSHLFATE